MRRSKTQARATDPFGSKDCWATALRAGDLPQRHDLADDQAETRRNEPARSKPLIAARCQPRAERSANIRRCNTAEVGILSFIPVARAGLHRLTAERAPSAGAPCNASIQRHRLTQSRVFVINTHRETTAANLY